MVLLSVYIIHGIGYNIRYMYFDVYYGKWWDTLFVTKYVNNMQWSKSNWVKLDPSEFRTRV